MPKIKFFLPVILLTFLLNISTASAQEVLLTPPDPGNSQIQKASMGAAFGPGWNFFSLGYNDCTTLTVLNELQADGGSALNVNAIFVKEFSNWETYTFQSPKQKKVGSGTLLAFNSNQKFFLQIDEKTCSNPDSARQAQIDKVREGVTAKNSFIEKFTELPIDLWTKLTNILNREGAIPEENSANKQSLDNLTIGGKTTVNDLGVTGKITNGLLVINGLDCLDCSIAGNFASINTLTNDLYLQNLGAGGINILGGKVTIDKNGNLTIQKLNVSSNSLGKGTLPAGQTSVIIQATSVTTDSAVFVTLENTNDTPLAVTNKVAGQSFKVELPTPAPKDLKFNWWIVN